MQLWWSSIALLLIVAAVGARALRFELLRWDDDLSFYENEHVKHLNLQSLRWMATDTTFNQKYMPLGWLLFSLSYQAFGPDATKQHALNVAIHAANAFLVFAILRQLAAMIFPAKDGRWRTWAAFFSAAVWAVHPLRVEVIAWMSPRVHSQACKPSAAKAMFYELARASKSVNYFARTA